MKNYIKSSLVIVIIMLLILFTFNMFKKDTSQSTYQSQYKTYEEYLEKQSQGYNEALSKANEQSERAKQLNDKIAEQQQRYDKLLDRWETQADKMDAILLKLEK
ncbi:MAG: hypothetical protein JW927_06550 [Deltaproteobacteria bacterium]|nr:hypothetical protein [Deltaproteobacteria bacterium]